MGNTETEIGEEKKGKIMHTDSIVCMYPSNTNAVYVQHLDLSLIQDFKVKATGVQDYQ